MYHLDINNSFSKIKMKMKSNIYLADKKQYTYN